MTIYKKNFSMKYIQKFSPDSTNKALRLYIGWVYSKHTKSMIFIELKQN